MAAAKDSPVSKKISRANRQFILILILLVLVNAIGWFWHASFDLTRDKRFTLTPATRNLLETLEAPVQVTLFLKGEDLPAAFRSLSRSATDLLQQFRDISGNKVSFHSVDPLGSDTLALQTLSEYRMSGIPVTVSAGKKGTAQKMIFPWALVRSYTPDGAVAAFPVFLQESNTPELSRSVLLRSEMLLEYNLANAIHQLTRSRRGAIAYLTGNGEAFGPDIISALSTLGQFYDIDTLNLGQVAAIPLDYDALFINRPMHPFSELDKFKIDQYVMQGKSVLWAVNAATGSLDSFSRQPQFNSMPVNLNLNDLFFTYGLRVNTNLIEDAVSSAGIPLTPPGESAVPTVYPWVYFPVLQAASAHPVVRHLNGVLGRFVSSLDTNASNPAVKKTILLQSSKYARSQATPAPVLLESAIVEKNPAEFREPGLIAAVLLEGPFSSLYATRQPAEVAEHMQQAQSPLVRQAPTSGKMIVIGDGDIFVNEFSERNGPAELGFYRFSDYRFDNRSFLLNCMEYLTDPEHLLEARAKRFENQLLDPERVGRERGKWQLINIGVPVGSVILLGVVFFYIRKRRYT